MLEKLACYLGRNDEAPNREIFPFLLNHLRTCRPKEVPQHTQRMIICINADNYQEWMQVLEKRKESMTNTQIKRIEKLLSQV